jgi:ABC-type lipoprotein export system ATPase subunit
VTGAEPVASLEHVSVEYAVATGVVHALQDVSYDFAPGTSTAIVGRSGSGKSTLISVLALLRQPNQGEVTVCGRKSSALADHDLSSLRGEFVGTVFQSFHLDPAASAAENVMLPVRKHSASAPSGPTVPGRTRTDTRACSSAMPLGPRGGSGQHAKKRTNADKAYEISRGA